LEDVSRAIRIRKQLAVCLFVKAHADVAEEGDRLFDGKRTQHGTDDRRSSTPEIAFGDACVGDVTARAATHEYLGARPLRALDQNHRSHGVQAAREDGRRKPGGTGTDDGDVTRRGNGWKAQGSGLKAHEPNSM